MGWGEGGCSQVISQFIHSLLNLLYVHATGLVVDLRGGGGGWGGSAVNVISQFINPLLSLFYVHAAGPEMD